MAENGPFKGVHIPVAIARCPVNKLSLPNHSSGSPPRQTFSFSSLHFLNFTVLPLNKDKTLIFGISCGGSSPSTSKY